MHKLFAIGCPKQTPWTFFSNLSISEKERRKYADGQRGRKRRGEREIDRKTEREREIDRQKKRDIFSKTSR